eukprot:scaffold21350_cov95-Skeletonema_marinoi.AAC.2
MPPDEAGLCYDGYQRRYLWTDAFGVLAYTSIAEMHEINDDRDKANIYRRACDNLIQTVHVCLGSPRSNDKDDAMKIDPSSPTGHVGLRIGKLHSRKITDYGMEFDGNIGITLTSGHGGIRWKVSVDSTAPPSLGRAGPSDDTLVALIVFSILEADRVRSDDDNSDDAPSLSNEIQILKSTLIGYKPRVTNDPLGWGLEASHENVGIDS